jgi:hypothetical protein
VVLVLVVAFALAMLDQGYDKADLAWDVATVFTIFAVPISFKDIQNHLTHFEVPELQKYEVRILMMVPVYSLTSWVCLFGENMVLYRFMEAFRSLYEAYVIWNFTYFLCSFLGPTEEMLARHLETKPQEQHIFPVNWFLSPWKMGHDFLFKTKTGTLQYVAWKIINVFIVAIASVLGIYGDGEWSPSAVYFWVTGITNLSQMLALYCLVLFYHATYQDLAPLRPLAKFLCIKLVVFFSFWQGCLISALVYFGYIKDTVYFPNAANTLQDFVVCLEMLFFAIAHHYVFSYKDFARFNTDQRMFSGTVTSIQSFDSADSASSNRSRNPLVQAFLEAANPRDLVHDIGQSFRRMRRGSRGSINSSYLDSDDEMNPTGPSAATADHRNSDGYGYDYMNESLALDTQSDARRSLAQGEVENKPTDVL